MVRAFSTLVFLAGVVLGSCAEEHACTEVGCSDQASFTLRPAGSHWDDGAYALEVTFDDARYSCAFAVPDALPTAGSWQPLDCTPALEVYLTPEVECEEHKNGDTVSQVCTPIPGQYYLQGSIQGTPATLEVALQRDSATLLDETRTLAYQATQPNGPECEPTCRQASSDFTLP